ncbi:immunoglobulin-like domain-containing protein [Peribacillus sp. NPDC097198]|uniref:immunoglobulin-like domain-containing protein n=1 Tax=Peribacillus sp. NPDC097198 TaxID=3364397 RepID=UPI00382791B3
MKSILQNIFIALSLLICFSVPSLTFAASDTVKPTILGASNKTIYLGSSFNAITGVSAKDNADGILTKNIKVSGIVNNKKTGTYKLTYSVTDKAKNKAIVTRTITVKKDTTKPVISGATNKTIYLGFSFNTISGVSAKDNVDGILTKNIKVSGIVNTKKAGTYKLTYSVTDKAKNKATVTRTITVKKDSTKPVISGATNKTIYLGSSFNTISGVSAKDNADGTLTKNIKVSGIVNTKKAGTYKLTYSVTDKAKNKATVTRTITVKKDSTKPVISGATNKTINMGDSFNTITGVSAKDNADGILTKNIKVSGIVNTKKAGTYKLTYSVTDKAKNKVTVTRTITVIDIIKPNISGVQNTQINFDDEFNPLAGISASDNNDGNITSSIQVDGSVNVNKTGTYSLTYSVTDSSGNVTKVKRMVTVIDNINPVISGVQDFQINFGDKFNALTGITASDNNDGDITSSIQVDGSVNVNKTGAYPLTYSVTDSSGNIAKVKRTVTVIDNVNPVISGAQDITIGLYTQFDLLNGVIASDNNDGDITETIKTSGSVDTNIEGKYLVTYNVVDASGNTIEVRRTVTVEKIAVSKIEIIAPVSIKTAKNQQLTANIHPENATNQNVVWKSSDESVATIDKNGVLNSLSEGTITITATIDGISASREVTISDRPNLYLYKSSSSTINNVIKSLSITLLNLEAKENVSIEQVQIYEKESLYKTFSKEDLENLGNTTVKPSSNWGLNMSFKLGIWSNQSKVVVTIRTENNKSYQYSIDI